MCVACWIPPNYRTAPVSADSAFAVSVDRYSAVTWKALLKGSSSWFRKAPLFPIFEFKPAMEVAVNQWLHNGLISFLFSKTSHIYIYIKKGSEVQDLIRRIDGGQAEWSKKWPILKLLWFLLFILGCMCMPSLPLWILTGPCSKELTISLQHWEKPETGCNNDKKIDISLQGLIWTRALFWWGLKSPFVTFDIWSIYYSIICQPWPPSCQSYLLSWERFRGLQP